MLSAKHVHLYPLWFETSLKWELQKRESIEKEKQGRRQQQKTMLRILERQKVDGEVNRAESKEHWILSACSNQYKGRGIPAEFPRTGYVTYKNRYWEGCEGVKGRPGTGNRLGKSLHKENLHLQLPSSTLARGRRCLFCGTTEEQKLQSRRFKNHRRGKVNLGEWSEKFTYWRTHPRPLIFSMQRMLKSQANATQQDTGGLVWRIPGKRTVDSNICISSKVKIKGENVF